MIIVFEINVLFRFFEKIVGYSFVGLLECLVDIVMVCFFVVVDEFDLIIFFKDMEYDFGCLFVYN